MSPTRARARSGLFPTLRGYKRGWLSTDILAGTAAGAVVIPQAMAYASIADLSVEVGLYTCMLPMLVYAALGGSRAMSVSTTSTIATLVATTLVSAGVATGSDDALGSLVTLTLMVGVILVIGRLLRLGSLIENINEATLIGVKVGLGATVALGQVPKLIGVDVTPTGHGFIRTVIATVEAIPAANLATAILSTVTIVILVVVRSVAPRVPAQLIVVAGGIVLVALTGIRNMGVDVIPRVPSGLPVPSLPDLTDAAALVPGALAVAVMAFLETASVARGIRQSGDPQVDSDRELLAVGVASIVGSFFHTLPAAGGFSQSAVMLRAGARSQVASIVTAVFAVLIALFLAPVLDFLPEATLASMVVVAVVGLIDVPAMVRLARLSRIEFWISVVVAAVGLAAGLLPAVAAGVLFTIGLVLREVNRARFTLDRDDDLLTIHLQASLYTASVFATQRAIAQAIDDGPVVPRTFVLDARQVTIASLTVIDALADFDRELAERGIRFEVSGLAGPPLALVRKTEWGSALDAAGRLSPGSGDSAQ